MTPLPSAAPSRRAPWLAVAALLLATAPAAAELPANASFELDAVTYLYATGVLGSGRMELGEAGAAGPGGAGVALPYQACAFVMLHPGTPNGRVMVRGLYANASTVDVFVDQFRLPDGKRGYAYDALAPADGRDVPSDLAIAGNASLRVNGDSYLDPATDNRTLAGFVTLLDAGVRDDATAARLAAPAADDDRELHVEIASLPGQPTTRSQFTFASSGNLPDGSTTPTDAFGAVHVFANNKFGGRAVLEISTSALAPAGMNELNFTLLAPSGKEVGHVTLAPALLADDDATIEAPLDEFGQYLLLVGGKVAFGRYDVQATLEPPAKEFRMRLWWENVTFGAQAYDDYVACSGDVGSPNEVVAVESVNARPDPPQFGLKIVVMGVVAAAAVVVLAVKLASDQVSLSAFRRSK